MPMNAPGMMPPPGMMMQPPVEKSGKPTIAAVFGILGFLVSLVGLIVTVLLASILGGFGMMDMFGIGGGVAVIGLLGVLGMVGGLMCAIFCLKRKNWMLALIGSILLLASTHFITGIIALIMVAL